MLHDQELLDRFKQAESLTKPPCVTMTEARRLAQSVAGLARLSGFSRMQVHRLVKSGKVVLGTSEALRWSWGAAQKNYPQGVPPLNLRRNHPAHRAWWTLVQDIQAGKVRVKSGKGADVRTVSLVARADGNPTPTRDELWDFVRMARSLEQRQPDLIRPAGIMRRRKQAGLADFLRAVMWLREKGISPCLRSIGRELGVSASAVSRWFGPSGHLHAHRQQLADACYGQATGAAHRRNGRPLPMAMTLVSPMVGGRTANHASPSSLRSNSR